MKLYSLLVIASTLLVTSCQSNNNAAANNAKPESIKAGVVKMASDVAHDLSVDGPVKWLNYFEQSPDFFMVNDGQLVFANNDSATHFMKNVLAKNISKVNLTWSNLQVDSLSPTLAVMHAGFHESLIDKMNNAIPANGYFTGTVEKTTDGWKFRNLHWSSDKAINDK